MVQADPARRPLVKITTAIDVDRSLLLESRFDLTFDSLRSKGVDALVVDGAYTIDEAMLAAHPDVRLICCIGAGYNLIDLEACRRRGVSVSNSGPANAEAVAEFALGLMLSMTRRLGEAERLLRVGRWRGADPGRFFASPGLAGRRVGIFGMGAIGRQIARRLAGFSVKIAYGGPRPKPDLVWPYFADLLELARWSDILVLSHRADEQNRGLVDAAVLAALGAEGALVNVARGSAVDEDALIAALQTGTLGAAALDVFENEPDVRPDLISAPNTVLTPHVAGGSRSAFDRMFEAAEANLAAFFSGAPLSNPVVDIKDRRPGG